MNLIEPLRIFLSIFLSILQNAFKARKRNRDLSGKLKRTRRKVTKTKGERNVTVEKMIKKKMEIKLLLCGENEILKAALKGIYSTSV